MNIATKKSSKRILNVAIAGVSGYGGGELVRLLIQHPHASIVRLSGHRSSGQALSDIWPQYTNISLPRVDSIADWTSDKDHHKTDVAFLALPHGISQSIVPELIRQQIVVFDLGADFRLADPTTYKEWYKKDHTCPDLLSKGVYGLSELYSDAISQAQLIAVPGCYPTSVLLSLAPLLKAGCISTNGIIVDAKSGISGAGRSVRSDLQFSEVNENLRPYGNNHRHTAEIEQVLSDFAGTPVRVSFTPHLIPMQRGILSSIYVTMEPGQSIPDLRRTLHSYYSDSPFIHISPEDTFPETRFVRYSNRVDIAVFPDRLSGKARLFVVEDNLIKGAAGQAVQNFNLRFDFDVTAGLDHFPVLP